MIRTLEIGGIVIPIQQDGGPEQTYEDLGGIFSGRTSGGIAYRQVHWLKIGTRITGNGWVPPGLAGLPRDTSVVLKCLSPRVIQSASNVIAVPAARRTGADYAPTGFAVVAGEHVQTAINLVVNTATLTAVAGAQGYGVRYWPEITVLARYSESGRPRSAEWNWQIDAEEI